MRWRKQHKRSFALCINRHPNIMNFYTQQAFDLLCQLLNVGTGRDDLILLAANITPQDWQVLLKVGSQNGVLQLLHYRFRELKQDSPLPEPVRESLHNAYLNATARNMVMLHHAGSILQALTQQHLDVIPLKGLYLAEAVYPAIGLRTFSDLDLLVRRKDLDSALQAMQDIGYQLTSWYDPADPNHDIKHLPPLEKEGWPLVEMHWSILEEDALFPVDIDGIWQRVVPARVSGVDVLAMDTQDLILHLALHNTYQHKLRAGLRSLYDIAAIIHQHPDKIDWPILVGKAKEWKMERVLWLTLHLVKDLLGAEVPEAVLQQLEPQESAAEVMAEARRQMQTLDSSGTALTPDLAALSQTGGIIPRLKLIWNRIFIPKRILAREYNVDPASPRIFWCYARRFRELFRNYSSSAVKLAKHDLGALAGVDMELENQKLKQWMAEKKELHQL